MPASAGIEPQKLADIRAWGGGVLRRAMPEIGQRTWPVCGAEDLSVVKLRCDPEHPPPT
jgi:hypothetical protein